jgi:iron complex outermembrane receptor protein
MAIVTRALRAGAFIICASLAASASAQSTDTPQTGATAPSSKAPGLETIVVTATKRKEDVTKVPLAITVIGGEALQDQHIDNMEDLTRAVPNISFTGGAAGAGPGLATIQIRGVSSQAGSATVGIYLDDVSMSVRNLYSLGSAEPKFFDIDHVEVLRGPQGTLYGASSMGGTIKFISNQPNLRSAESGFSAEASTTEGGGPSGTLSGVYNAVVVPGQAALRLGVQVSHIGGYIDQVSQADPSQVIKKDINSENDLTFKAAYKWAPNAQLDVTPALFYQKVRSDGLDVSHLTDINGNTLPANQTDQLMREPATDELIVPSLTINYGMGAADLTSVTSYYKRTFNRTQDGQAANSEFFGCCLIGPTPPGLAAAVNSLPSAVYLDNSVKQFSQELRLASKPYEAKGWPFIWLAGIYYSDLKTRVSDNEPVFGINSTFAAFGASPADPNVLSGAFPNDFPNDNAYFSERRYSEKQTSLFGELTYYIDPTLRFTVGLRYLRATETLDRDGNFYFAAGPQHSSFTGDYRSTTPKYALTWDVAPGSTLFATAAEGFRLGGANREIPLSLCGDELLNVYHLTQSPGTFASDSLWSYELGGKSTFLNNTLYVSASAFMIKWKDIQQDVQLACTFDFEGNFGKATSKGFELEMHARPTADLTLGLFGGTTRATFDEDVPSINVTAGQELLGVPKWNAAVNGEYRFYNSGSNSGFVRAAVRWVGPSKGSFDPSNPDYSRPSYTTIDASVGADIDSWEVSLFGKNLANDQTILQRPLVQFLTEAYRQRPRTIGLMISRKL